MAACIIRAQIDAVDDDMKSRVDVTDSEPSTPVWQFGHVYLGSRQRSTTVAALAAGAETDSAFENFRVKLATCTRDLMAREALESQNSDSVGSSNGSPAVQGSDIVGVHVA
jgi:hypothetical protein